MTRNRVAHHFVTNVSLSSVSSTQTFKTVMNDSHNSAVIADSSSSDLSSNTLSLNSSSILLSFSSRERLTQTVNQAKKRKRAVIIIAKAADIENFENMRALNREIRWNIFLFFTNNLWMNIVKKIYESDINVNSNEALQVRAKIFDVIKELKSKIFQKMKISDMIYLLQYLLAWDNDCHLR